MKRRAAAARAMGVRQRPDLSLDALALQRVDHEAAFPRAIEAGRHVLRGAASASAEPGADRRRPLGARAQALDKLSALARRKDARALARQNAGHGRPVRGDAVAARVERHDRKLLERFSHQAPSQVERAALLRTPSGAG